MSDSRHIEALELDHRPGSVDMNAEDTGKFPFHAFEFDSPETANPRIKLLSPWSFVLGPLRLGTTTVILTTTSATGIPLTNGSIWLRRES